MAAAADGKRLPIASGTTRSTGWYPVNTEFTVFLTVSKGHGYSPSGLTAPLSLHELPILTGFPIQGRSA